MANDLFDKLNSGFTRLGRQVRSGAKELHQGLKQTAGIGVGTMQISLDRFDFRPGDTVAGTVKLALSEPMDAERLVVELLGTRERVSYEKSAAGGQSQKTHTETLCHLERELDGARSYFNESYSFELAIPRDIDKSASVTDAGVLGDVARVVQSVTNAHYLPAGWRVVATLDIPWKRNITKKVDISVGE